jgi:hypothetical protein
MNNTFSYNYIFRIKLEFIRIVKIIIAPIGFIIGIKSSIEGKTLFTNLNLTPTQQIIGCTIGLLIITPSVLMVYKELFSRNDYKKITSDDQILLIPELSHRNLLTQVDLNEIKRYQLKPHNSIGDRTLEIIYSSDNNYRNENKVKIFEKYFDNSSDFADFIDNIQKIKDNNLKLKN